MLLTVVCKALIIKDGKVLLLRLSPKGGSAQTVGSFDLPGGRMRAGETFAEVLQRELWEECALELPLDTPKNLEAAQIPVHVDDLRLPGAPGVGKTYEPAQAIRLFFQFDRDNLKSPTGDRLVMGYEHDDYVWVDPKDAKELLLFPGIGATLAKLFPAWGTGVGA